jgi:hypothetical protein
MRSAGGVRPWVHDASKDGAMSEVAARYRKVAETFAERAPAVPGDAWDPAPCEGWAARDIVRPISTGRRP